MNKKTLKTTMAATLAGVVAIASVPGVASAATEQNTVANTTIATQENFAHVASHGGINQKYPSVAPSSKPDFSAENPFVRPATAGGIATRPGHATTGSAVNYDPNEDGSVLDRPTHVRPTTGDAIIAGPDDFFTGGTGNLDDILDWIFRPNTTTDGAIDANHKNDNKNPEAPTVSSRPGNTNSAPATTNRPTNPNNAPTTAIPENHTHTGSENGTNADTTGHTGSINGNNADTTINNGTVGHNNAATETENKHNDVTPGNATDATVATNGAIDANHKADATSTAKDKTKKAKFKFSKKKKNTKKGKKFALKYSYTNGTGKVTFKSSNKKVASVNSKGVVKAKKNGTTTITATLANGEKETMKITVK